MEFAFCRVDQVGNWKWKCCKLEMAMLWQSRHLFKAGCNAVSSMVGSATSSSFAFGVRFGVRSTLHFSPCDGFGRVRALSTFPWSEDVAGKHSVVKSKGALLSFVATRSMGTIVAEDVEGDGEVLLLRFLERLKNYEKEGVPKGAGTDSVVGFDLERMERLLVRLGNPLSNYPVESLLLP